MTDPVPTPTPTLTEKRYGFGYRMATVDPAQGKALPVSRGEIGGPDHQYVTVPINAVDENPGDPLNKVSLKQGWSFLYGPTSGADVFAFVRLKQVQAGCSTHLRLYIVQIQPDGSDVRSPWPAESPERFVGDNETHTANGTVSYTSTHLDAAWHVPPMAANERLRLEVDYWNATDPAYLTGRIVGARITGTYWRSVLAAPAAA